MDTVYKALQRVNENAPTAMLKQAYNTLLIEIEKVVRVYQDALANKLTYSHFNYVAMSLDDIPPRVNATINKVCNDYHLCTPAIHCVIEVDRGEANVTFAHN